MLKNMFRGTGKKRGRERGKISNELAKQNRIERCHNINFLYAICVLILLVVGIVLMYSASYPTALKKFGSGDYFFAKQLKTEILGVFFALVLIVATRFPWIKNAVIPNQILWFVATSFTMFLLIYTRVFGITLNGATRWIEVGHFQFQPSEVVKFLIPLLIASMFPNDSEVLFKKKRSLKWTRIWVFVYFVVIFVDIILILLQPHLSCFAIVGLITVISVLSNKNLFDFIKQSGKDLVVWFKSFKKSKYKMGIALLIRLAVALSIAAALIVPVKAIIHKMKNEYQADRVGLWRHEFDIDIDQDDAQQMQNSMIAIGSGEWHGLGFMNSRQKEGVLPECYNDFVFAIICEEIGFIGSTLLILLYLLIILQGLRIAKKHTNKVFSSITICYTMHIAMQTFLNMGVVTGLLPNTGISLPFISYGGTAILMQIAEVGLILALSQYTKEDKS